MNASAHGVTTASNGRECTFSRSRCASRAITQFYDLVLAPSGLKSTQFLTLKAIDDSSEIAQSRFSRTYLVAIETLTRNFAALRRKGFIVAHRGSHREHIYRLTDEGRRTLTAAVPYWQRAQERLRTILGAHDWRLFLTLCDRIALAANEAEQGWNSDIAKR